MNDYSLQLKRIKEKLSIAQEVDSELKAFGARTHEYLLQAPASLQQVSAFEKKFCITLPEDYRAFITTIGSAGAGPFYGLYHLEKAGNASGTNPYTVLSNPIRFNNHTTAGEWETHAHKLTNGELDINDDRFKAEYDRVFAGILIIGMQGADHYTGLIINGEDKGRVIYLEDQRRRPHFMNESNFLDWYERWLDEIIAGDQLQVDPPWFGYTLGGTEQQLLDRYFATTDINLKKDCLAGLLAKAQLPDPIIGILEKQYDYNNKDLWRSILAILTKHAYGIAYPLLRTLTTSDPADTFRLVHDHAKRHADDWEKDIVSVVEKRCDNEQLFIAATNLMVYTRNVDMFERLLPYRESTNEVIRFQVFKVHNEANRVWRRKK